ncbi:MAG: cob(I)yrinic acid a,c-diamide adenosyltransferase [Patescibacteria group bacterium]
MVLFTGKGDDGTTTTFGCKQRMSKSSVASEALGTLDECNSFLGLCRSEEEARALVLEGRSAAEILREVQDHLFTAQAELAGSPKTIPEESVKKMEVLIHAVEQELPPIKSFFVPGATRLGALFDVARTISRRAERRATAAHEDGRVLGEYTRAYLNRLSSLLYALARLANHRAGKTEEPPMYRG